MALRSLPIAPRALALTFAVFLIGLSAFLPEAAMAKKPDVYAATTGGQTVDVPLPPLTAEEAVNRAMKLEHLATMEASISGPSPDCPVEGPAGAGDIQPSIVCPPGPVPSIFRLSTHPRHQHRWFYCGTAVVQVISNYTRGYTSTTVDGESGSNNYKTQTWISANKTKNDLHGQTYLGDLIAGLNDLSILPSTDGWHYAYWHNPSFQSFHNAIVDDTWNWHMPLAAGVNPRDTENGSYYLPNWDGEDPSPDYGHYIDIRGYEGLYSDAARWAYYDDSSGGHDEVQTWIGIPGSTGQYRYGSYGVWETMKNNQGYLVW